MHSPSCRRSQLPRDTFAAVLAINGQLATCFMRRVLQHSHGQCSPLVVAMLRLDLLAGRLPPKHQPTLGALESLLRHRCAWLL